MAALSDSTPVPSALRSLLVVLEVSDPVEAAVLVGTLADRVDDAAQVVGSVMTRLGRQGEVCDVLARAAAAANDATIMLDAYRVALARSVPSSAGSNTLAEGRGWS
jgi:hypothetical protein